MNIRNEEFTKEKQLFSYSTIELLSSIYSCKSLVQRILHKYIFS